MFESLEKERARQTNRQTDRNRKTHRETERGRHTETQRQTEREREGQKVSAAVTYLDVWISDVINKAGTKLQALVYDILSSTTAVFSYAIGPRKLSANEQFFGGAQTVVRLLQTTQIISDVCLSLIHI